MKTHILVALLVLLVIIGGYFLLVPAVHSPSPEPRETLSPREAIDAVVREYPELASYETTSLPPSSVETKPGEDGGWNVVFMQRGSGLPGILTAKCYSVSSEGTVTHSGDMEKTAAVVESIDFANCDPEVVKENPDDIVPPDMGGVKEAPVTPVTPVEKPISKGGCYRGGCSGQLCTDQPDMVSTCEYRPEYGCYQSATCERQPNGQCGWTQDETLRACLAESVYLD